MNGFFINRLVVSNGVKNASVKLRPGANLITGPSDTGKSYIFSAINYALGRSSEPKEIIESVSYNDIFLEIITYEDQKIFTIHRQIGQKEVSISQASIELFSSGKPTKYLTTGVVDNPKNISSFLLSLCNMSGKKLLKNKAKGITQNLSIKNILSLTFVDEGSIIKETSPFYFSSQYSELILSQSLLHLLLTGEDFAEVVEVEDQTLKETRISGKLEFLGAQISQYAVYKDSLTERIDEVLDQSERDKFLQLDTELQKNIQEARQLTQQKNDFISRREDFHKELRYNQELQKRFSILEQQYLIDVERLDFILEAKVLSDQLGDVVCPLCSSPLTNDHLHHIQEQEHFHIAAAQELEKNRSKLNGLRDTINELKVEERTISISIAGLEKELTNLEYNLSQNFSTKIQSIKGDLKDYLEIENVNNEISFIEKQLKKLFLEKNRLEGALKDKESYDQATILSYTLLTELAESIETRLKNWNYESNLNVNFNSDYKVFDIVISGKSRKSYGKGKRSISYAASLIGLLDLCYKKQKPFTNLLIMDSPLTTYEEKKRKAVNDKDILQTAVLKAFFIDVVNLPINSQVIMLDNKEPDTETLSKVQERINIIVFTGDAETGRAGFF